MDHLLGLLVVMDLPARLDLPDLPLADLHLMDLLTALLTVLMALLMVLRVALVTGRLAVHRPAASSSAAPSRATSDSSFNEACERLRRTLSRVRLSSLDLFGRTTLPQVRP